MLYTSSFLLGPWLLDPNPYSLCGTVSREADPYTVPNPEHWSGFPIWNRIHWPNWTRIHSRSETLVVGYRVPVISVVPLPPMESSIKMGTVLSVVYRQNFRTSRESMRSGWRAWRWRWAGRRRRRGCCGRRRGSSGRKSPARNAWKSCSRTCGRNFITLVGSRKWGWHILKRCSRFRCGSRS